MSVNVVVLENKAAVAKKAADMIEAQVKAKPASVLGFATGSTPEGCYAELAARCKAGKVSFKGVATFNLDEYLGLDGEHDQSYRYFMNDRLFNHIDIRPWNTNVLNGVAADPGFECLAFERKILACGGVDLWLLGIGNNGHIAFNEPGSAPDSRTRIVRLTESTIKANSDGRFFKNPLEVPHYALSAGIGTIREAREIVLLATGDGKADAVKAALKGPMSLDCPASLLQKHDNFTFICDKAAAAKIS
ncbi:MAG: glucosamine-6-phosphate deaminase [Planctomycetes bacterium]|nr:glucosamine-6-phosphate deaminase [Planctomycetota bacterium]